MKHFSAILFLSIFLVQLFGYSLVFRPWEQQEEARFLSRIYDNQPDEDLFSVKCAVQLPPYTSASEAFEWTSGEVILKGIRYKYVKKRIIGDSIEFLCTPDQSTVKTQSARELFFQLGQDLQDTEEGSESGTIKPFFPDCFSLFREKSELAMLFHIPNVSPLPAPSFFQSRSNSPAERPPDAVTC